MTCATESHVCWNCVDFEKYCRDVLGACALGLRRDFVRCFLITRDRLCCFLLFIRFPLDILADSLSLVKGIELLPSFVRESQSASDEKKVQSFAYEFTSETEVRPEGNTCGQHLCLCPPSVLGIQISRRGKKGVVAMAGECNDNGTSSKVWQSMFVTKYNDWRWVWGRWTNDVVRK